MLIPYRLEIFDKDYNFRSFAPVLESDIRFDYLTLETSTVTVQAVEAYKGDYARLQGESGTVYAGIITDAEVSREAVTFTINPLLSLFDVDVYIPEPAGDTIEGQLAGLISETFITNADTLQNINGLTVTAETETAGRLMSEEVQSLAELLQTAAQAYGITADLVLDISARALRCTIGARGTAGVIEADLRSVLSSSFTIGDSYGRQNKTVCLWTHTVEATEETEEHEITEILTFYKHKDGTIDTEDRDRIAPVFFGYTDVSPGQDQTFEEAAALAAREAMGDEYDNEITLVVLNGSKVLPELTIGQTVEIVKGGVVYRSILTAYELAEKTTTYTFGTIRTALTKNYGSKGDTNEHNFKAVRRLNGDSPRRRYYLQSY